MLRASAFLLSAVLLFASGSARAQDTYDPRWWSDELVSRLTGNDAAGAYRMLLETDLGAPRRGEAALLRRSIAEAARAFGPALRYQFLGRSRLGTSMQRLTYLLVYERAPVMLELTFYRPMLTWNLVGIRTEPSAAPPPPVRRTATLSASAAELSARSR